MGSIGPGIFEAGVEEGNVAKAKEVVLWMHRRRDDISYIADTLEESEERIEEWLGLLPA